MPWDSTRRVHPVWLFVEFGTCVGVWSVVTLAVGRAITGAGFIGAVVTGVVLAGMTWVTVKLGWRETPRPPGAQSKAT